MTGGVIYGIFLYGFDPVKPDLSSVKGFFGGLKANLPSVFRIIGAKFTINLVCNVFMNTLFLMIMGYGIVPETFWIKVGERVIKNAAMLPVEVPVLAGAVPDKGGVSLSFQEAQAGRLIKISARRRERL